ncbi:hypothetical protein GINT2_001770 [Glugoides intestinalis]
MYAIITRINVTKKKFLATLTVREFFIELAGRRIALKPNSNAMFFCTECPSIFSVTVLFKSSRISQSIDFEEKSIELVFLFESVTITVFLILSQDPWMILNSSGSLDEQKKIFVNLETLETSLENTFDTQKQFPSFSKVEYSGSTFFIDSINKMVIKPAPVVRKTAVLERVKKYFSTKFFLPNAFTNRTVIVDRQFLFKSAYTTFLSAMKESSIYDIAISFKNEIGQDHGALKREFLYLLFGELINSKLLENPLGIYDVAPEFECADFPYFYSSRKEMNHILDDIVANSLPDDPRIYFVVLGATIASIFLLSETLQVCFSLILFESLLMRNFKVKHIQDVELQKNLLVLPISEIENYVFERMFLPRKNQYDHIKFGFEFVICSLEANEEDSLIVSEVLSKKFSAFDFPFIFYHFEPISAEKLKSQVYYVRCTSTTQEIEWIWECLEKKDQHFLSKFLLFITGSGNLPNMVDNSVLSFELTAAKNELFKASACIKRLYVPHFDTLKKLSNALEISVMNTEGFHFI